MWVCDNCGQPMDDKAIKCSMCGTNKPEAKTKKTETAQVLQTFDFPEKAETKKAEPLKAPDYEKAEPQEPSQEEQTDERPVVTVIKRLAVTPKFWIVLASVVLMFILIPWTIQKINQLSNAKKSNHNANHVEADLRSKFELIIDDMLPDKLEWAREVMRLRVPTRFPEELMLESNKPEAEVKYENKEKISASFRMLISYHFSDAYKKTYIWQPVVFFFEIRNNEWVLIGDRWLRESELILE